MLSQDEKIIFKFDNGNGELVLDDTLFSVSDYQGLEASVYDFSTDVNINHDGEHLRRAKVLPREIVIKFDAISGNNAETRRRLISFFNPKRDGVLTVSYVGTVRHIDYMVAGFKISSVNIYEPLSAMVTLKCLDPSFKSATVKEKIETLVGGWSWKFSLPFKLKEFGDTLMDIDNKGDVETPVEISFQGPATNPEVKLNGNQYIRLKKSITADEVLYVNTGFREKTVQIINGDNVEDAWDYLDMTSTFFWLQPGENQVEYSKQGINSGSGVTIAYKERYLGI